MLKILSTSNTKELKMFVLTAISVFSCAKIMRCFFPPKTVNAPLIDVIVHAQSMTAFKGASEARFLRAHVQARGSYTRTD